MLRICLLSASLLLYGLSVVMAQTARPARSLKVGLGLAGHSYLGDFAEGGEALQRIYPGARLSVHLEGPTRFQLQLYGGFGKFAAQSVALSGGQGASVQNTFVETPFFFGDLRVRYRFGTGKWQPYVAVGAGLLHFSPRDADGRRLKFQDETREAEEFYNAVIPELPATLGLEGRINEYLSAGVDYTFRFTPTDYLDNVGQLGARPGKDVLHAITLNLFFTLPNKNTSAPPPLPADSALISPLSEASSPDAGSQAEKADVEAPLSSQGSLSQPSAPQASAPQTQATSEAPSAAPPSDAAYMSPARKARVQAAIAEGRFTYHKVQADDTLESLARQYHLSPDLIRNLNYLRQDALRPGSYLRLPEATP